MTLSKDAINRLPLGGFDGRIELIDAAGDPNATPAVASTCEALLASAARHGGIPVIGFDTETRPSFRSGEYHPIALIQLAVDGLACLVRIHDATQLPEPLRVLFERQDVIKVAQGPRDELTELRKRFALEARNVVDLVALARDADVRPLSLRGVTAVFLRMRISKSAQTSNWEAPELTDKQLRYAATDAWACQAVFRHMAQTGIDVDDQHAQARAAADEDAEGGAVAGGATTAGKARGRRRRRRRPRPNAGTGGGSRPENAPGKAR